MENSIMRIGSKNWELRAHIYGKPFLCPTGRMSRAYQRRVKFRAWASAEG